LKLRDAKGTYRSGTLGSLGSIARTWPKLIILVTPSSPERYCWRLARTRTQKTKAAGGESGSKSYEARAKKLDTKVPGATPFQDKLKEYALKAPTVGMFGEISKDGESILEIAAWKRADEYCTFAGGPLEDQATDAP